MDEIVVRPAQPGHGTGLAQGWLDAGSYYAALGPELFQVPASEGLVEWMEERLARPRLPDTIWLVAEVDGQAVGDIHARLDRPMTDVGRQLVREVGQLRVFVNALAVQAAYRRRGVGTRLLEAVEGWGRQQGATLISLDTFIDSPLSVPFYERRMGYQRRAITFFQKRLR
jgi:GNAT superfamily N-acetyltransferase